jgi:YD repeat-containing protein
VDESGNILQTTLDENGQVVDEDLVGSLDDLLVEEEYLDDQGQVVSRVRDESGHVLEQVRDDEGNVVDVRTISGG